MSLADGGTASPDLPPSSRTETPDAGPASPPLDLRLLPAGLAAWGAAWVSVHGSADRAMTLGLLLALCGVVLLAVLMVLGRQFTVRGPVTAAATQVVACSVAAGVTALSAAGAFHSLQSSGWEDLVSQESPVTVQVRVDGDPRTLARPGFDGAPRVMVHATVTAARQGSGSWQSTSAEVVIIDSIDDGTTMDEVFTAGQRYQGQVRTTETDAGDRATALLFPQTPGELTQLPADPRGEFAGIVNELRDATRDASGSAIGDAPALLPGLILGDRSLQSEDLTSAMQDSGMSHLTVVSGTHCALVMGALMGVIRLMGTPRWIATPAAIGGLVLYVTLVHAAPSVIRAAVMGGLGALAMFSGRRRVSFSLLCVCVLGLLVWDPWYAVEPAFQLSVTATAGIILVGSRIQELLGRFLPGVVAAPTALAFSAQLFVTPVLLPLNGGVNTYAVLANVLGAPLLPLVTVPGTFAAVISTTLPWLATVLLWCCGVPAAVIGVIGRVAADLPRAVAPWPDGLPGAALVVLYLGAAVALAQLLILSPRRGAFRAPRTQPGWSLPLARPVLLAAASASVTAMILPGGFLFGAGPGAAWRVALCDVGQGDMLVVRTGEEAGIVVDAGEEPRMADECLRRLGVEEVEVLMITHEHRDHYGGAGGVGQGREVTELLYSSGSDWEPDHAPELTEAVEQASVRRGAPGDAGIGQGDLPVRWQVWKADEHHPNPNDNSLVVHFEIIDPDLESGVRGSADDPLRLLTTGDLEEDATRAALDTGELPEHVDLLKVAHHGAANGGLDLLDRRRPTVALIGVGDDNAYGHPAESITSALDEFGVTTYRTDVHGTVVLSFDGGELTAETLGASTGHR